MMSVKSFRKILVAASVLAGFGFGEAYSSDGFSDGGLLMLGRAIQEEFQKRNDKDADIQDYLISEPVSPFAFSSPIQNDDLMGEEFPD